MSSNEILKQQFDEVNCNAIHNLGYSIKLFNNSDYYNWDIILLGAPDSLYNGGIFHIKISFPNDYPNHQPELIFLTPIYHLNVNPKKLDGFIGEKIGHIGASFINFWKPTTTVKEILVQLYSIFYLQNNESPYGLDRADEFINNRALFELKRNILLKNMPIKKIWTKE